LRLTTVIITSLEVVEADPDVHLELDEKGKIMGIEIWNAQKSGLIKQVTKATAKSCYLP